MKMRKRMFGSWPPGIWLSLLIVFVSTADALADEAVPLAAPKGWMLAGSSPHEYETGVDPLVRRDGKSSGFIKSAIDGGKAPSGFGTLMQMVSADNYAGQRVRFSADVRTTQVDDWAGLWMRVDSDRRRGEAFDNMQDRPIKGTSAWRRYEIVLDVADDATAAAFGILLTGRGAAWINNLKFEKVKRSVPVTSGTRDLPKTPQNLGFDDP